jgi:N-acyl-D-amino-acid deacylase
VPVVISHHKVAGVRNHGRSRETLSLIEERMRSQAVGLDCYPYTASSTILTASRAAAAQKTLVTWSKPHPEVAGTDLAEITIPLEQLLPAGAIYFTMDEADVRRILAFEHTMIGSDGLPHDTFPHPRLWGTFPRILGHYSRRLNLFPLETAVHKMTGLPAKTFGLQDRGVLKPGMAADITIFDADEVDETATFTQPIRAAKGIDSVIVNGTVVWHDGQPTGARPGQVLMRASGTGGAVMKWNAAGLRNCEPKTQIRSFAMQNYDQLIRDAGSYNSRPTSA